MTVSQSPADDAQERITLLDRTRQLFPEADMDQLLAIVDWALTGAPRLNTEGIERAARKVAANCGGVFESCEAAAKNRFRGEAAVIVSAYLGDQ